jgi:septum formation protein
VTGAGAQRATRDTREDPPRLILASASPRRLDILRQLGLESEVRPAEVDESYLPGESPAEHVERLARAKAEAVAEAAGGEAQRTTGDEIRTAVEGGTGGAEETRGGAAGSLLVIGGDTVVVDGDRVLAKPVDSDDAVRTLLSLSGRSHEVLSGLALVQADVHRAADGSATTLTEVSRTVVRMRPFDEETARRYVGTGEPMVKAGGYGIQGLGAALVESIEGDYYSVVGFPVGAFLDLLERAGWRFAFGRLTRSRKR